MGRRYRLVDAAKMTGLSIWELRTGAISGKYPYFRVGGPHGRLIFDIDLIEERIEELMRRNVREQVEDIVFHPARKL